MFVSTLKTLTLPLGLFGAMMIAAPQVAAQSSSLQLEKKAQNINELIQREARYLSASDVNEVDRLLNQIRRVIKKDDHGGGGGGGDFDGGGRLVSVAITIENQSYNFKVAGTAELVEACMAARAGISQSVDDVQVSINYLKTKSAHNTGSWWKGSLEVCGVVAGLAAQLGLDDGLVRRNHVVAFSLEGKEELTFSMVGRNAGDIGDKCMNKLSRVSLPSVDDISLIVNGSGLIQRHNTGSWWKTAAEICQQVVGAAAQHIRD
jgi:phage shock protein PspC (stress-responsive transcriptional regulator)